MPMFARTLLWLVFLALAPAAFAADNATLITPCSSGCVTMRSKDVGSGIQSMIQILGDTSGNAIYGTAGTANTNVLTVQGIASGTALAATQSGTWTVQPGNTANTTPWLASISQGGNTALVKAGNTAATTDQAVEVADANLLSAVQAATPAGENHIGEVGSNQIGVQVAQTVTASSAYTSGNAVGGLMTIAGAARVSGALGSGGTGGILQNVAVNSKSVQTGAMEVWIFNANPSGSTCTDKTAFSLVVADFDKVIGIAPVPGTAANNSGWFSGGTASVGMAANLALAYDLSSATSLFACLVTRSTPTFTATTDISLKFNMLRS
jgi:hypothetical protein